VGFVGAMVTWLRELHAQFTPVPPSGAGLVEWVDALHGQI
jgi:hypothetical protein